MCYNSINDNNNRNSDGDTMTPKYKEIKAARGGCICEDGLEYFTNSRGNRELGDCKLCDGTGNKILTFTVTIDAPNYFIFNRTSKAYAYFKHPTFRPFEDKPFELPYKINQPIPVTCDACKPMTPYSHVVKDRDKSKLDELIGACPVCNGSPETTLTVLDIQVIKTDKWYFEVHVLEK